jgi:hypothetical protein
MFKVWSESNIEAKKTLKPDLGLRVWDNLTKDEKKLIWEYVRDDFFNINKLCNGYDFDVYDKYLNSEGECFEVYGSNANDKRKRIDFSIIQFYHLYKAKKYTKNFIQDFSHYSACLDFYTIFFEGEGDAVLELISHYLMALLKERDDEIFNQNFSDNIEMQNENEKLKWQYRDFDVFALELNDVFEQFGLNIYLTRNGFIPKQDDKIVKDIFEPVLKCLSHEKWTEVNKLFSDAFVEYRKNTPNSYSTCITHTVSAVQAFLQILVNGKTGIGDISKLIPKAQKENLIPSDMFTKKVFETIESVLMRERQERGDPHPKKEYANEKNAKLVLNLAMVFLQHSIQN